MKKIFALSLIALFTLSSNLYAQTTWTGTVSTDWFDPGNWDNGVPASGNNATVPSATPFNPVIVGVLNINYQLLNSGNIINNGIIINNSLITNNGIIDNMGDIINNGNVINNNVITNNGNIVNNNVITNNANIVNNVLIVNNALIVNNGNILNCGGNFIGNPQLGNPLITTDSDADGVCDSIDLCTGDDATGG